MSGTHPKEVIDGKKNARKQARKHKKTTKKHQEGPVSDDTRMIPDPGASAESLAGRPRVRRQ